MRHSRSRQALVLLLLCAGAARAADGVATRRPLKSDDIDRTQTVSEPQCSPDGQWVAYVVTTNDRDADEPRSAIWTVSWDGSQHVALTAPASGTRAPRFSPDGRYLAYLTQSRGSEQQQLMVLDRRGGEPRALTAPLGAIDAYAWAPDGRTLVLAMEPGDETASGGGADAAAKRPRPIVIEALHFKQDIDGYLSVGHQRHLYLLDVATQRLEAITRDPAYTEDAPVWSPDGSRIAFLRSHERGEDPDGRHDLAVIDARAGANARTIARPYTPKRQQLAWSPDGATIAFRQGLEPKYRAYYQDRLAIVPSGGGAARTLTDQLDRGITSYAFAPDRTSILVAVEDDAGQYLARVDLATGAIASLIQRRAVITSLSVAGGHVAALYADDTSPYEVHAIENGKLRRLTAHNDAFLAEIQLGAVEELRFRSRDGTEVHGSLVRPPTSEAGRRYPTVLMIHGGPDGQDEHSLDFDGYLFERQQLAAHGYVVVGVNYRGSGGRGRAFAKAIFADWCHREVEDLRAALDHVIHLGIADPARLGVGGWSYGGILTNCLIASDQRLRAAYSGAGSANQLAIYGADEYSVQYDNELGPPWKNTALWLKVSYAFFHADRIRTPTLFMGGDQDFNVPIAGGEQMYAALRTLGVPTQLVVYPGQNHELTRPSFLRDKDDRIAAWFGKYLASP